MTAGNCEPVCVPWYVFHKMLAGLLDQYQLAGNSQALDMAKQMAAWTKANVESVLQRGGEVSVHFACCLWSVYVCAYFT